MCHFANFQTSVRLDLLSDKRDGYTRFLTNQTAMGYSRLAPHRCAPPTNHPVQHSEMAQKVLAERSINTAPFSLVRSLTADRLILIQLDPIKMQLTFKFQFTEFSQKVAFHK